MLFFINLSLTFANGSRHTFIECLLVSVTIEVIKRRKVQFSDSGDHILGGGKSKDMITA